MIIAAIIFISICVLFSIYMVIVAHNDTITYEKVYSEKIPPALSGYHIFFIADIHRRKLNDKTLNKINKQIDLVLIGGDLMDRHVPFNRMRNNIIKLKKWSKPIYFVWGNNDYEIDTNKFIQILMEENVIILEDSLEDIYKGNEKMNLIGFNYYKDTSLQPLLNWEEVDNSFTILLTHKPSAFNELSDTEQAKVDLVLAGHTHGGQIRIFGLGFYDRGGQSYEKDTIIFITEGYGYTLLPFRLQTKAECHIISLFHKQN